jgi:hypothetical protein
VSVRSHFNRKNELRIVDRGEEPQGEHVDVYWSRHAPADTRKKTFIMATLASTLVGTFTASMGLYDRVSDARQNHKQRARDTKQDGEIKELKESFEKSQKAAEDRQKEIDRLKSGAGDNGGSRRGNNDVGYNLGRDAAMVQRMYDDGFGRYGNRFAQGDGSSLDAPTRDTC